MIRSLTSLSLIATAAVALGGCVLIDDRPGTAGPDEFGVVTRAPLTQPPDFALRPPRAGAASPNEVAPRDEARQSLVGGRVNVTRDNSGLMPAPQPGEQRSAGERALLHHAEALNVDPNIREQIERESGRVKEDESLVDSLVFWRDSTPDATVVEPNAEAARLKSNEALGAPMTQGATPIAK